MNNIETIKSFIQEGTKSKLLVNQVNDEIGFFYVGIIEKEAIIKNIKLNFKDKYFLIFLQNLHIFLIFHE